MITVVKLATLLKIVEKRSKNGEARWRNDETVKSVKG